MGLRLSTLIAGLAFAALGAGALAASDERTISFYHIHTKETLTVTYKRDGKFIPDAMKKIDWLMRDWRKDAAIEMDPNTIDIIWEMYRELGSKEPIHVICGHRSRGTNEMLRKTVGGQASNSQHITGKAIDIAFPDVPAKLLRYSAMIRERGGVGYYPTSAIPFVHVDTSRVRHWPNMPRDELALLFPSGRSKHHSSDGSISKSDVERARKRSPEIAQQVASYFDLREQAKAPVLVADASGRVYAGATPVSVSVPEPKPAERPRKPAEQKLALATPAPAAVQREKAPKLIAAPQLVERPSTFTKTSAPSDRGKLDALFAEAAREPETPKPQLVQAPEPAARPAAKMVVAALAPTLPAPARPAPKLVPAEPWAQAPEFDDDHPEELFYRPFPLAPLLTATASADDPQLSHLVLPDVARTLDMIDDVGTVLPMRFRPGQQAAELMWSKEFRGQAVNLSDAAAGEARTTAKATLPDRRVKTSAQ